jgi:hypothetical protein
MKYQKCWMKIMITTISMILMNTGQNIKVTYDDNIG